MQGYFSHKVVGLVVWEVGIALFLFVCIISSSVNFACNSGWGEKKKWTMAIAIAIAMGEQRE